MKKSCWMLLVLFSITPARAALITETLSFDLTASAAGFTKGNGLALETKSLHPFDSSLGQLERVKVSVLQGSLLTIRGNTGLNRVPIPVVGGLLPVPYTIIPTVKIGIGGLTDFFDITSIDGFYNSPAFGFNQPFIPITGLFDFSFTIDETSEIAPRPLHNAAPSGATPISVPFYSGKRSNFLDTEISSDLLLFSLGLDFISTALAPNRSPTTLNARLRGNMQVVYDYTPVDPVSAVPVPAAIYLFGTAVIGLVGFRRRKTGKSPGY